MHRNLRFQNAIELSLWPSWHTIRHTTGMSMDRILVVFCDPHYLERKANIFLSSPKIVSIFWLIFVNRLPAHTPCYHRQVGCKVFVSSQYFDPAFLGGAVRRRRRRPQDEKTADYIRV